MDSCNDIVSWTLEEEEKLVEMWVERPCLYAVRTKEYSNRNKRQAAVKEISDCVGKSGKYKYYYDIYNYFIQFINRCQ